MAKRHSLCRFCHELAEKSGIFLAISILTFDRSTTEQVRKNKFSILVQWSYYNEAQSNYTQTYFKLCSRAGLLSRRLGFKICFLFQEEYSIKYLNSNPRADFAILNQIHMKYINCDSVLQ